MLARVVVEIRVAHIGHRAVYTAAGLDAWRAPTREQQGFDLKPYARVRQALGMDQATGDIAS